MLWWTKTVFICGSLLLAVVQLTDAMPFESPYENGAQEELFNDDMENEEKRGKPLRSKNTLLISSGSIIRIDLESNGEKTITKVKPVWSFVWNMIFDCQQQQIVWSEYKDKVIRTVSFNSTKVNELLSGAGQWPQILAIDWSSRNIYYTDINKPMNINVLSFDGRYWKKILDTHHQPFHFAIDLVNRHLFFDSRENTTKVMKRVDLSGANSTTFIDSDINGVEGLVVLHGRQELCWMDINGNGSSRQNSLRKLCCIGLDGRNRRVVFQTDIDNVWGLTAVNEERFYWTSVAVIHSVSITGEDYSFFQVVIEKRIQTQHDVVAAPDKCHEVRTECAVNNGGCPYLCLPKTGGGVSCVCPDNVEGLDGCDESNL